MLFAVFIIKREVLLHVFEHKIIRDYNFICTGCGNNEIKNIEQFSSVATGKTKRLGVTLNAQLTGGKLQNFTGLDANGAA